jgi:cytochrome c553
VINALTNPELYRDRRSKWTCAALVCGLLLLASIASGLAQPKPPAVDPLGLLETHCVRCHGGEKTKGGLDLVTREALMRGGENGASIVPGKPDTSLLVQMIRHEKDPGMPHKQKQLPAEAIKQLADWVLAGAPYSRPLDKSAGAGSTKVAAGFSVSEEDRQHWSFLPLKKIEPPALTLAGRPVQNPIDRFVLARLKEKGLGFSPPAGREALIRRATFDLIGLPPTPDEIDAFVQDSSPDAWEKLIDRLLASPHYGERWGRHWLDLARYAESDGFEHDAARPNSWRYRDYVIRAFNADKPYDRFIREQIAGDELWPRHPDALIATGFNLLGPDMVDSSDQVQRRHNILNDTTDTTALAFLGLTMGCARCHDHKFEPIAQRDYYSLQAFFTPTAFLRERTIAGPAEIDAYEAAMRKFNEDPKVQELNQIEARAREIIQAKKLAKLAPEAREAHQTPPEKRTTDQENLVLETLAMIEVSDKELTAAIPSESKARRSELRRQIAGLPKPPNLPTAMALAKGKDPTAKTFVLYRGEYSQPGDAVEPGFPQVLRTAFQPAQVQSLEPTAKAGNRSLLANWIASPENPLTARVMVNRIWQHHFGIGLVATPSDFGVRGQPPTHPELLDWLAGEFIARGWSIKQMHKLMLVSETYRQRSDGTSTADPENHLYGRMNRLRLEGEAIRDGLLAISGQLNPKMGGPGVSPPIPEEVFKGAKGWTVSKDPQDHARRSVYLFARRNLRFPFLEVFDAPDNNLSCPARERSTTAPQALTLLNADEVTGAAKITADRLTREAGSEDQRITRAYRLILGRDPAPRELALAREFTTHNPLNEFCRALFNLNAFVYLD